MTGVVLTHGAGSNADAPLLVALDRHLASRGCIVLRYDLPFRQQRRSGPPFPAGAARDRAGLAEAVAQIRSQGATRVILGGHSYGGRQSSMLCAEQPGLVDSLLLFSYPLHPPNKPHELRTAHFPDLRTPCLFVHGTQDPFGSVDELAAAVGLITAPLQLLTVPGAGHSLTWPKLRSAGIEAALDAFCLPQASV